MQSVADEAEISVGLIYQYFGNKEDLLRGVVVDILEDFRDQIPQALAQASEDPVDRLTTAFRACCLVVDAKRAAVNLTYRESKTLTPKASPRSWPSNSKPPNPSAPSTGAASPPAYSATSTPD